MAAAKSLEELVKELPPNCQLEVRNFVEFLLMRHAAPKGNKLRQDWAGMLRSHREAYTSVALQHQASTWRAE